MPTLDDLAPKTRLDFPDGASLLVGTRRNDDDATLYAVHVIYDSGQTREPEMEILLPTPSIDILISVLQDAANQARFIMGQKRVDYPQLNKPPKAKKRTNRTPNQPGGR